MPPEDEQKSGVIVVAFIHTVTLKPPCGDENARDLSACCTSTTEPNIL